MTKTCAHCQVPKPSTEFYAKGAKRTASWCKDCFNAYCIRRWIDTKIRAIELKGSKCQNCSLTYPETPYPVFEFHHVKPSEKDVDWTKLRLRSWEKIVSELDKCILLCSNCHRIHHHNVALSC